MPQSILVAIDESEQSTRALETALTSFTDPEITVMHVLDPADFVRYSGLEGNVMTDFEKIQRQRTKEAESLLEEAEEFTIERGISVSTVLQTGDVPQTIIEYVDKHRINQIVVGSRGRSGVSRVVLGSVAETIVRRAPVPVTVVR